jgi:hypothetical protein
MKFAAAVCSCEQRGEGNWNRPIFRNMLLLAVSEVSCVLGWVGVSAQQNESWILRGDELILCEGLVDVAISG